MWNHRSCRSPRVGAVTRRQSIVSLVLWALIWNHHLDKDHLLIFQPVPFPSIKIPQKPWLLDICFYSDNTSRHSKLRGEKWIESQWMTQKWKDHGLIIIPIWYPKAIHFLLVGHQLDDEPNLYIKNGCFTKLGVSLNGGTPISHPKCCSFLVEKPTGLLGKPTILGTPHISADPSPSSRGRRVGRTKQMPIASVRSHVFWAELCLHAPPCSMVLLCL